MPGVVYIIKIRSSCQPFRNSELMYYSVSLHSFTVQLTQIPLSRNIATLVQNTSLWCIVSQWVKPLPKTENPILMLLQVPIQLPIDIPEKALDDGLFVGALLPVRET